MDIEAINKKIRTRRSIFAGRALVFAKSKAAEIGLSPELNLPSEISGLCTKTNNFYSESYRRLSEIHGEKLPSILAYAKWVELVSCLAAAKSVLYLIERKHIDENEYTRLICTADGYAKINGWVATTLGWVQKYYFHELTGNAWADFGFELAPGLESIFLALNIHWLWIASNCDNKCELSEFLFEAMTAASIFKSLRTLVKVSPLIRGRAISVAKKTLSKKGAKARHASTYDAKALIFDYLDKNPPLIRGKSKKAVEILDKKLVDETYRTILKWIDEWQKRTVSRLNVQSPG